MIKNAIPGILSYRRPSTPPTGLSIYTIDTQGGTGSNVHSLSSLPAGCLAVVTLQAASSGANGSVVSTPSLTWVKRVDASASSGDAEIWTASHPSGGSLSITTTLSALNQSSVCYIIVNQESTLNGASSILVNQSLPSTSISTTKTGSILIGVISDINAVDGSGRAYVGTPTETYYFRQ